MRLVSAARAFRNIAPSYPIFDTPRNASSAYARTEETRFGMRERACQMKTGRMPVVEGGVVGSNIAAGTTKLNSPPSPKVNLYCGPGPSRPPYIM